MWQLNYKTRQGAVETEIVRTVLTCFTSSLMKTDNVQPIEGGLYMLYNHIKLATFCLLFPEVYYAKTATTLLKNIPRKSIVAAVLWKVSTTNWVFERTDAEISVFAFEDNSIASAIFLRSVYWDKSHTHTHTILYFMHIILPSPLANSKSPQPLRRTKVSLPFAVGGSFLTRSTFIVERLWDFQDMLTDG